MSVLLRLPGRTRIAIGYVLSACGGVASEQEQHAPPLASAGAAAAIDAGVAAASGADASAMPDGSEPNDAGAADPCPSDTVFCCDGWTGARSRPTCLVGFTRCGAHLDLPIVESECQQTPDICHVDSMNELEGKPCSADVPFCPFGRGCSSCRCECPESTRLWLCQRTAC